MLTFANEAPGENFCGRVWAACSGTLTAASAGPAWTEVAEEVNLLSRSDEDASLG